MATKTFHDLGLHLPPQNLDAERSVLGCMLLETAAIDEVADLLSPKQFYSDIHAFIYSAILHLHERNVRVDAVTLAEELDKRNQLQEAGGVPYISELLEAVPYSAHAKYYAGIVRDKFIQRSLTDVCTNILRDVYEGSDETTDVLTKAERGIFEILERQDAKRSAAMGDILVETLDAINSRLGKGAVSGLSTGFRDLDRQTNGFQPTELIILAARPSMGKTALVCNIAEWCADCGETTTLIFSLEQSRKELAERFLCIRAKLDGHRLRKGELDPAERHSMLEAASELGRLGLFIDDVPGRTVGQISALCRQYKRKSNLGLVIIDYLQLIEPEDKRANREQQIAQITRRLKGIAKEIDVPVVALSQLNRGVELREDKRPRLADLRESGAIEQDADIVIFLHRPDAYNPDDQPGLAEIIVAKHRSGPTGIVNLQWRRNSMRFEDYDPIDSEAAAKGF